ncbi:hypothetical protein EYZ11_003180 [Aspergillus tanneri]|uniref:FAD-binding FR-type domain-containing protein n=1 Tax=Aspergillus tanneri TaxID=1220188 RepID=A0A4S3JNX5_9EURO|nr:hypothetical protein EYZ11_003180 [Aspergillus tanneri]
MNTGFTCGLLLVSGELIESYGIQYTRSLATYDEKADVIRLEMMPASSFICPTAGQFYYLYQPFRFTGWESHPFTLGYWSSETESNVTQVPLLSDASSSELQSIEGCSQDSTPPQLRLIFWIRPYDGWTRSLRQQCKQCPDGALSTTILLEGPYGEQFPLWKYESVLFVAGGTGIAAILPYIQDHVDRSAAPGEPTTHIQDIQLVWTTRQLDFVRQIASVELSPALSRYDFHASFYITSTGNNSDSVDAANPYSPMQNNRIPDKDFEMHRGRPDLQSCILAHAHEAQLRNCSAVVLVCGPPTMADEARSAVHLAMLQGYQGIRYVEESFSW